MTTLERLQALQQPSEFYSHLSQVRVVTSVTDKVSYYLKRCDVWVRVSEADIKAKLYDKVGGRVFPETIDNKCVIRQEFEIYFTV